jgi:predicted O-methyltransferase YrrM
MSLLHTDTVDRVLSMTAAEKDDVLAEMETRAEREGFPTVGPEVGEFLRLCARLTGADAVFEFGSGYGYSAYWVAPAVGSEGRIVLTEIDAEELDEAESYFERGGYADRAVFERGDAIEIVDRYDGPFDLVLLDHENDRYVEGFEAVRDKVSEGGVVVAENVLNSGTSMTPGELEAYLRGEITADGGSTLDGIETYLSSVRADPGFETTVLPIGDGVFASVRI